MIQGENYIVHIGNNLDILPTLQDCSVDSIVTDPPYELGFMGKKWDSTGIAYNSDLWRECLRVLKPGGHLLSFGGTRTWHRVAVAIEDAGFEVRDSIAWMYGSGFPKSLDVAKAINKAAGVEYEARPASGVGFMNSSDDGYNTTLNQLTQVGESVEEAKQWEGWGTALKPAFEPIVVARKPLIGTVAENVLTYGTGGLNIDASRIGISEEDREKINNMGGFGSEGWINTTSPAYNTNNPDNPLVRTQAKAHTQGRWPANVILDEYSAELLDEQSGITGTSTTKTAQYDSRSEFGGGQINIRHPDKGGASRFFYVAKASKRDRNEGLENLPDSTQHKWNGAEGHRGVGDFYPDGSPRPVNPMKNFHPTVKPTDLMRYLIKLVTPPNGTVLDPFTGSGSTGKAAILDGFRFIGIEMTEDYIPIIEGRLKHAADERSEGLF
jgi:DNA modification methylase